MKIIIVGAGEVGYYIAQKLSEENQDVFLIDKDPEKIRRITENLDDRAILGSGTSPETLRSSGIKDAEMLVAATDSDEVNLFACLLAKNLNPYILKVARVRSPEYLEEKELFSQDFLGVDRIINPVSAMVEQIRSLMTVPGASDVVDFEEGRVKLIGITVKPNSPFVDRQLSSFRGVEGKVLVGAIEAEALETSDIVNVPLSQVKFPKGALVGAIVRGEEIIIPRGDSIIRPKDRLIILALQKVVPKLEKLLTVKLDFF